MGNYRVMVEMDVQADTDALAGFAHEELRKIAAADPTAQTELGPEASSQQIADYYAHNPKTVVSAIVRAMIADGLVHFDNVMSIGANSVTTEER